MRTALALALIAIPSVTSANPITVGASLGLSETKIDSDNGADPTRTIGIFGRLGFSRRVAGQLELMRYKSESGCDTCTFGTFTDIKTGTASLIVDLTDGGRWVPTLAAGIGLDRDDGSFPQHGHHIEGGFGVEYRGEGGFTFGIDLRMGGRSIDRDDQLVGLDDAPGRIAFAPTSMQEGEYRSGRVWLGIRF